MISAPGNHQCCLVDEFITGFNLAAAQDSEVALRACKFKWAGVGEGDLFCTVEFFIYIQGSIAADQGPVFDLGGSGIQVVNLILV